VYGGWRALVFIWEKKLILGSISLDMFSRSCLGGAVALLPVLRLEKFCIPVPGALACCVALPGLGAALMAIVVAHRPIRRRGRPDHAVFFVASFGVMTIVFRTLAQPDSLARRTASARRQ